MKRIGWVIAVPAIVVGLTAGTASAENDGGTWTPTCEAAKTENYTPSQCDNGGQYPPAPIQIVVPNPVIDYGSTLTVKGKGLCPGIPAIFAVQDNNDWTHRYFSPGQWVAEDGSSWYTFSASELSGFYGGITVYVKQFGECEQAATTGATINKKAPAPASTSTAPSTSTNPTTTTPTETGTASRPDGGGGAAPTTAPAAASSPAVTPIVLSSGVSAPAASAAPTTAPAAASSPAVTPIVLSSGVSAPAASAAPTAAASAADSLPVTGSEPSRTLQLALAFAIAGLAMVGVSSVRRRMAHARTR